MKVPEEIPRFNVADLPRKKAATFLRIYANNAGVAASFFDIDLVFGQLIAAQDESGKPMPHIEDLVTVSMSWEHAKALAKALDRTIAAYEKDQGPVRTFKE